MISSRRSSSFRRSPCVARRNCNSKTAVACSSSRPRRSRRTDRAASASSASSTMSSTACGSRIARHRASWTWSRSWVCSISTAMGSSDAVIGQGRRTHCLRGRPTRPRVDPPGRCPPAVRHERPVEPPRRPGHQGGSRGAVGSWPSCPHRAGRNPTPACDPAPGGSRTRQQRSRRRPSQGRRPTTAPRSLDPTSGQLPVPIPKPPGELRPASASGTAIFIGEAARRGRLHPRRRCARTRTHGSAADRPRGSEAAGTMASCGN